MSEYAFRKIDIDAPRGPAGALSDAKAKSGEVRGLVSKGDIAGALNLILTDPPYGDGVDEAKNLTSSAVLLILNSTRTAEIPNHLKNLDPEQQDHLMAYLYKAMGTEGHGGDVSGSVLLTWHEKLTEVAGVGCIVRVMTDRRTL
ncbi:putative Arp2/3 complex 16 kDa subunit [Naematelia encephala]|uniref:Actin-related protein 2/3 complex subunit 5 n=1 Tax=Naematelia encephala TaxID=71784 RepID=A0A1Y2BHF9_9TREE|nr:putative Arp2/3 complex 16 kDa subunit [Naematelia encephala]